MRGRVRALLADSLARNGALLVATTLGNAAAGYLFWALAARASTPAQLGVATSAVAAFSLAAALASLGLGQAMFPAVAAAAKDPAAARGHVESLGAAATATLAAGLLAAPVVAVVTTVVSSSPPVPGLVAAAAAPLATFAIFCDLVMTAARASGGALLRNAALALGKLAALAVLVLVAPTDPAAAPTLPLLAWLAALAASVVLAWRLLVPARLAQRPQLARRGWFASVRPHLVPAAGHHLVTIGGQLPSLVLPLVATATAGVAAGALFYVCWMVASLIFTISSSLSSSLFAEGSHHPEHLARLTARTAALAAAVALPAAAVLVVAAPVVLAPFGDGYASAARPVLGVLALGAVFDAATNIAVAVARVKGWRGGGRPRAPPPR